MRVLLKLLTAVVFLFSLSTCKKNNTGGDATLVVFPQHHGSALKGATVYVKFKAKDLPSNPTSNYDLKIEGDANENHVHIKNLRYGKYYIYSEALDPLAANGPEIVKGGVAVVIKWRERKKELNINLPITE